MVSSDDVNVTRVERVFKKCLECMYKPEEKFDAFARLCVVLFYGSLFHGDYRLAIDVIWYLTQCGYYPQPELTFLFSDGMLNLVLDEVEKYAKNVELYHRLCDVAMTSVENCPSLAVPLLAKLPLSD